MEFLLNIDRFFRRQASPKNSRPANHFVEYKSLFFTTHFPDGRVFIAGRFAAGMFFKSRQDRTKKMWKKYSEQMFRYQDEKKNYYE